VFPHGELGGATILLRKTINIFIFFSLKYMGKIVGAGARAEVGAGTAQ
jgi:hypothetical protein